MEILFLVGATHSFFFSFLFLGKKLALAPYRILVFFFLINGLLLLDHYFELIELNIRYPHLLGLTYTLPILIGPLLYFYTISIINQNILKRKALIHLAPFIILTLYFLFDYYFLSAKEKLDYFYRESQIETSIPIYLTEVCLNFSIPIYTVLSLLKLNKHENTVRQYYSDIEVKNLKWLKLVMLFFMGISIIILATNLFSDLIPLMDFLIGDSIIYSALAVSIFYIGYFGIKQKIVFPETLAPIMKAHSKKDQYKKSGLRSQEYDKYLVRLLNLMKIEKPYLNPKLSLKDLSAQMDLSENKLSQLINEGLNKKFYDFVNEYRVEEVKRKIEANENQKYSLLGIAYDCGFNSKSSFNRVFKEVTGKTPSEYKKNDIDNVSH